MGLTPTAARRALHDSLKAAYYKTGGNSWDDAIDDMQDDAATLGVRTLVFDKADDVSLSRPILNISNMRWRLGGATFTNTASGDNGLKVLFQMGNSHPAQFNLASEGTSSYLPCFGCGDVSAGALSAALDDAGDRTAFTVDQFCWVRTETEGTTGGYPLPARAQLVKVRQIDVDGTIHFYDQIDQSMSTVVLSPFSNAPLSGPTVDSYATTLFGTNVYWHAVDNVHVDGEGAIFNGRSALSTRTGMYASRFRNIELRGGANIAALNTLIHSEISGLSGITTNRCVELKCHSYNSVMRDIRGVVTGDPSNSYAHDLVADIGERSRRCALLDSDITLAATAADTDALVWDTGSRNLIARNVFRDYSSQSNHTVVNYSGTGTNFDAAEGNRFIGNDVICLTTHARHMIIGAGTDRQPVNYLVEGNRFSINATTQSQAILINGNGTGGIVRNNVYPYALNDSTYGAATDTGNTVVAP